MNNIDILEEKEKKAIENLKGTYWYVGEEGLEENIKIVLNLIESLIAENKELKEEVERQGVARAIEGDYIEKNFINKNEIKEEIQELKNMKIDGEVFKTAVNYAIKILQSLLGKE